MYLNKAFIIGNLTKDPEVRALPSGIKVCSFSVATNRVWKDKNGVRQESADFHNIVVFGRQAETAAQYLKKGSGVLVEGRMQTRSWDGQDGAKKYRTEIVADRVQFGARPGQGGGSAGMSGMNGGSTGTSPASASMGSSTSKAGSMNDGNTGAEQEKPPMDTIDYPEDEINPDDIPF